MNNQLPWWLGNAGGDMHPFAGGVALLAIWSVIWTGLALWHAARRKDTWWFMFFLVVHTLGLVEILYLIFVVHLFVSRPSKKTATRRGRK